jgi:hypothetical protein
MKKTVSVGEELRKKLFDIEVSLYLSQEDMDEVGTKLLILNKLQKDLMYNIELHKSGTVATSISEYKKTLSDLKKTRTEIESFLKAQKKLEDSIKKLVTDHEYYNTQYEQFSAFDEQPKVLEMEKYAKAGRLKKKIRD